MLDITLHDAASAGVADDHAAILADLHAWLPSALEDASMRDTLEAALSPGFRCDIVCFAADVYRAITGRRAAPRLTSAALLLNYAVGLCDDVAGGDIVGGVAAQAQANLLAGTVLSSVAPQAVTTLVPPADALVVLGCVWRGLSAMASGQRKDLALFGALDLEPRAVEAALAKSTAECGMYAALGAAVAGVRGDALATWERLGSAVGYVAEVNSDCLDVFDPRARDVAHGARTLPIALALVPGALGDTEQLRRDLAAAPSDPVARDRARDAIIASGSLHACGTLVEAAAARAERLLAELAPPHGAHLRETIANAVPAQAMIATPPDFDARLRHAPGVRVVRRSDDGAIVLCRGERYLAVSPRALEIWNAFDGNADLRDIAERYGGDRSEPASAIVALAQTLARCGFVTFDAHHHASDCADADSSTANTLLEGYVWLSPACAIEVLYRGVRHAFHPAVLVVACTVAFAGLIAAITTTHYTLHANLAGFASLGLARVVAICAHEAAHALTLRHYGGLVSRAGIGWYWFSPVAFVDTSDAHTLPRAQRIAVCLAGPALDAVVAGVAAIVATLSRDSSFAAWSWTFAGVMYLGCLANLDPLIETDWYYALTDLVGRPNLRQDGLAQLLRPKGAGKDRVASLYGVAAVLYAIFFACYAAPAFARATLAVWLAPVVPVPFVAFVPVGASVIAAVAIGISIARARPAAIPGVPLMKRR
jgi:putative peptide zinc metalloprotease protein